MQGEACCQHPSTDAVRAVQVGCHGSGILSIGSMQDHRTPVALIAVQGHVTVDQYKN